MTEREIIAGLIDVLEQFPTGLRDLLWPSPLWDALVAHGFVETDE